MSTTSTLVPSPEIGVSSESQSSLGASVGGGVAAAVVVVLAVAVLGVSLLLVRRRKYSSKLVLQSKTANGGMANLDNPVYGGECMSECQTLRINMFVIFIHCRCRRKR